MSKPQAAVFLLGSTVAYDIIAGIVEHAASPKMAYFIGATLGGIVIGALWAMKE